MIFKDICVKKTYEQNGGTKTKWLKVGTLKELEDGRQFIEINIFPGQDFYVFEQKEKAEANETTESGSNDDVKVENIPF
jgi:hypothetical protein